MQCVALGFVQVIEAVADERVGEQAVLLDGVVALFAEAVGAACHTIERGVDFAQERLEVFIVRSGGDCGFQAELAVGDLSLQELHFHGGHRDLRTHWEPRVNHIRRVLMSSDWMLPGCGLLHTGYHFSG